MKTRAQSLNTPQGTADTVILLDHLTKSYGRSRGIQDLSLEVRKGEVFGLLGPNGAGKTTSIRLLLGLLRPTAGHATVFGLDAVKDSLSVHRRFGYTPGDITLYGDLTGLQFLEYLAGLRGLAGIGRAEELIERFQVETDRALRTLSHGNRQKLILVQAFMHDPELLLLDEPTLGLDPIMQRQFYTLLTEVKARSGTVLLSSHILSEVEAICGRVAVIRAGRLVALDDVRPLMGRAVRRVEVTLASMPSVADFAGIPCVRELDLEGNVLRCRLEGHISPFLQALARFDVLRMVAPEPRLEDVFYSYYESGEASGEN